MVLSVWCNAAKEQVKHFVLKNNLIKFIIML
jgi:hypothetical protein